MNNIDGVFGVLIRQKREHLGMSQAELAHQLRCPQPTISRLERGEHGATLRELVALARALNVSMSDLLVELEKTSSASAKEAKPIIKESSLAFSPVFYMALVSEEATLAQLAAHGVRFLGGSAGPALFRLGLEETLLAALKHAQDPRIFEALPSLVAQNAQSLDWSKLTSGAFVLQLQNRLGLVVAAALQLKDSLSVASQETWKILQEAHIKLAEALLDRDEILGPKPKSQEAFQFLAERTPPWMRFWHILGYIDARSLARYEIRQ